MSEEGAVRGDNQSRRIWVVGATNAEVHWGSAAYLFESTLIDVSIY